jgi:hypothetical protein
MEVEDAKLGPRVLDFYATSLERGLAARDTAPAELFLDVHHDAIASDPLAVAEAVYAHAGVPLEGAAREALVDHARANPRGAHGTHRYRLEDYGLSRDQVRERFAPYCDRFDIASAEEEEES